MAYQTMEQALERQGLLISQPPADPDLVLADLDHHMRELAGLPVPELRRLAAIMQVEWEAGDRHARWSHVTVLLRVRVKVEDALGQRLPYGHTGKWQTDVRRKKEDKNGPSHAED